VSSKDFVVVMANLFRGNNTKTLTSSKDWTISLIDLMSQQFKIELETTKQVIFLINLLGLKPENAFEMFKQKVSCHISQFTIQEWIRVNNLNEPIYSAF
jgi:dihydroxyacetone kinase